MAGKSHTTLRGIRAVLLSRDGAPLGDLARRGCLVERAADDPDAVRKLLHRDTDVLILDEPAYRRLAPTIAAVWPWIGIVRLGRGHTSRAHLAGTVLAAARGKRHHAAETSSERFAESLDVLHRLTDSAFAPDNLKEAFRTFSLGLGGVLPCDAVGILHAGRERADLALTAIGPVSPSFLGQMKDLVVERFERLAGCRLSAEALNIRHEGEASGEGAPESVAATFSVPVVLQDEVRSLLTFASATPQAYSGPTVPLLYRMARQLATVTSALGRMRQFAARDSLTTLYNRRGLEEELDRIWQAGRHAGRPAGIVVLDIDHFKTVNDSYGHPIGDEVLREFADLIQNTVRASDVVGRYGGDEFVVALPGCDEAETRTFGERLLAAVRGHVFCGKTHGLRIMASVGGASGDTADSAPAADVLVRADQALYVAKRSGRNRVCMWSDPGLRVEPPAWLAEAGAGERAPLLRGRVLVIDDEPQVGEVLKTMLEMERYEVVVATTGGAALAALDRAPGQFDATLVDLKLANESGLDLLDRLASLDDSVIRIVVTGYASADNAIASLRRGAFDLIEKPILRQQLCAVLDRALSYRRLLIENRRYQLHLEDMVREKSKALSDTLEQVKMSYDFTLEALAAVIDVREHETGRHSLRVARLAQILAGEMGLSGSQMDDIAHGALLHDIGKIAMPDAILLKPGPLTETEWKVMRTHPEVGYGILKSSPVLKGAAEIVRSHQERYDGSGYPRGLKGARICLGARIFAVVDAYDAIRTQRAYSSARTAEEALREILAGRGRQFDPAVVDALMRCLPRIEAAGRWPKVKQDGRRSGRGEVPAAPRADGAATTPSRRTG